MYHEQSITSLNYLAGNLKFSLSNENKDKALIICSVEFESILWLGSQLI